MNASSFFAAVVECSRGIALQLYHYNLRRRVDLQAMHPDPNRVQIRLAGPGDARLLAEIGRVSFEAAFGADNTPENMASYLQSAFSEEIQARELAQPGSTFLIAESEDGAAGYARLQAGPAPTCITGWRPVELVRFYLMPEWIGSGLAGRLMQACLETAWGGGYDVVWLGVWQKKPRAIHFYQKWGFVIVGEHTFQLGDDHQTDWLMQCERR